MPQYERNASDHVETTGWAVITTHPYRERVALENLERQNFCAYSPSVARRVRHARRSREVLRPLFPGYLFVKVHLAHWRPILSTVGVRSIVRCGEKLSVLSDSFIEALRERESNGAIRVPERHFQIGQKIRIAGGPFDGLVATIVSMNEKDRLSVLMELLMRTVKVSVGERDVAPL
jgi:transcriptional antiterminator RfaH